MLKTRDSHGAGYVLAIVGVAAALVVVIIGASTIAALNHDVPKELWAIGGALSGALVGILAPPPRTHVSGKVEAPLSAAEEAVLAANRAAAECARREDNAGKALVQGAQRGLQDVELRAEEAKASVEAPAPGDPTLGGSPRFAAENVVQTFVRALDRVGSPSADGPTDHVLVAERAVHKAAVQGAEESTAVQETQPQGADEARIAALDAIDAALKSAAGQAQRHAELGTQMGNSARAATKDVEAAGNRAWEDLLADVPRGKAGVADQRHAQDAAVTILSAQKQRLDAQPAADDQAKQAATNVHGAAVAAATNVTDAAAPAVDGWLSGLKTIFTEAKIIVPLVLFAVTITLGVLLGLGVIHVASVCKPTVTPATESPCSHYVTLASQASNVLISLAAATVGALVGIFAGHPGAQANATALQGG